LVGHEISKVPNHFPDEETFAAQKVERLEMFREQVSLEFFRPDKGRQLQK